MGAERNKPDSSRFCVPQASSATHPQRGRERLTGLSLEVRWDIEPRIRQRVRLVTKLDVIANDVDSVIGSTTEGLHFGSTTVSAGSAGIAWYLSTTGLSIVTPIYYCETSRLERNTGPRPRL